ncbi:GPP34 family phosphoprotein [Nakamurella antarctica]|uniref:GPP34 family phosphoprotein n=1 Tax=Nakamurella antarctica TaxID=1902245 RepID=A0A3G8ZI56_9ACTN|nr:GPP34 family phosphoprotein [Nakamurella antarctica]AZI57092.1 GPP34 family phosphoprotein [Nakamurella antarctica]
MGETNLSLIDELALLALREENGRPLIGKMELDCAFAGALLAELEIAGRIALVNSLVLLVDQAPVGHDGVDSLLRQIAADPEPHKPEFWVRTLQPHHPRTGVLTSLTEQGLVKEQETKILGLFTLKRYPQISRVPEAEIRDRMSAAIDGQEVPSRVLVLISLVTGCGLARKLFTLADRPKVRELAKQHWSGLAVRSVIDMNYTEVAAG